MRSLTILFILLLTLSSKSQSLNELYEKTKRIVEELGYASVDEFVTHVLEREVNPPGMEDDDKAIVDRLKGLGYIA